MLGNYARQNWNKLTVDKSINLIQLQVEIYLHFCQYLFNSITHKFVSTLWNSVCYEIDYMTDHIAVSNLYVLFIVFIP